MRAWCLAIACEKLVALSHVGGHGVITLAVEAQQLLLVLHLVELATVRALALHALRLLRRALADAALAWDVAKTTCVM